MSFLSEIVDCKSISIVGLEKNTGKTECLNYILRNLPQSLRVAVTSVGIDGETVDQVTKTSKPQIKLKEGIIFSTSEYYYNRRRIVSEIIDISNSGSALGRIVSARALGLGNLIVSGPSSVIELRRWSARMKELGAELVIIDGALSRLSIASAGLSEAMVLTTGAAVTPDINRLVRKTKFVKQLIGLDLTEGEELRRQLEVIDSGVWGIDENDGLHKLDIASSLLPVVLKPDFNKGCRRIFVSGALTDGFLKQITERMRKEERFEIIIKDFTRVFADEQVCRGFLNKGGVLSVAGKSRLLAVCVNPTSPQGYRLDSDLLCSRMRDELEVPVYDVVKGKDTIL